LLISTVSQTQQQAMMSAFFFYFPAVLLSGFMFPIANMPEPIQWLTYAIRCATSW
jgi:ABC-2 type transport system permease protein